MSYITYTTIPSTLQNKRHQSFSLGTVETKHPSGDGATYPTIERFIIQPNYRTVPELKLNRQ